MTPWLVVGAVGLGSWLFRISMLVVAARSGLPPIVERAARHAVPISFAALATSAVANTLATSPAAEAVVPVGAMLVGSVAVRRTGTPQAALLVGLPTAWALAAVVGA